jgi:hypothetical protein
MTYNAFVIMHAGQYCAFKSYCEVALHDNPLKASLYSSEKLANKRLMMSGFDDSFWVSGVQTPGSQFMVQRITMELK